MIFGDQCQLMMIQFYGKNSIDYPMANNLMVRSASAGIGIAWGLKSSKILGNITCFQPNSRYNFMVRIASGTPCQTDSIVRLASGTRCMGTQCQSYNWLILHMYCINLVYLQKCFSHRITQAYARPFTHTQLAFFILLLNITILVTTSDSRLICGFSKKKSKTEEEIKDRSTAWFQDITVKTKTKYFT